MNLFYTMEYQSSC